MQTFSDIYEHVPSPSSISNKSYVKHQALGLLELKIKTRAHKSLVLKAVLALLLHTAEMLRVRQKGGVFTCKVLLKSAGLLYPTTASDTIPLY